MVINVELSPKFHDQATGVLVLVSVNITPNGALPDNGVAVKLATGTGVGVDEVTIVTICEYQSH